MDFYCDKGNYPFGYSGIDVSKYEKEGSLMIKDSLEGYFPPEERSRFHKSNRSPPAGGGSYDLYRHPTETRRKAAKSRHHSTG
jgi:hypothetical protein